MRETALLHQVLLKFGTGAIRLFRRNVGLAWIGEESRIRVPTSVYCQPGDVVLRNARPFRSGAEGEPDIGGWKSVVITQADVGKTMAVVVGLECKGKGGRLRDSQRVFLSNMESAGALCGEVRSLEDAGRILGVDV